MKRKISTLTAASLLAGCAMTPVADTQAPAPVTITAPPAAAPEVQRGGLVSAADPRAASAGVMILKAGGSATDAAIATMLMLTVVEPQSSGIGGGGFVLRHGSDGALTSWDGRETAPSGATQDWFLDENGERLGYRDAVLSGLSVGVPGNIRLAHEMHQRHGKLEWAALFAPAIHQARDGWLISERFHLFLGRSANRAGFRPEGRALFYGADSQPLPVGTKVRNEALANTLEQIAAAGPDAFYSGDFSAELAETVARFTPRTGAMTQQDVTGYEAKERPAFCGKYRDYKICGMGPPSSGATTVFAIMKQMEQFDMTAYGPDNPVSWHIFAESQRLAYADRELYLADGDFTVVPMNGLMDEGYLRQRGSAIDPAATMAPPDAGAPPGATTALTDGDEPPENGTSHFVAIDGSGNAVTYTSTIEGPFGSGLMVGGFYLNNELTDFSFTPRDGGRLVANRVEGGKRPRSSMSPTLVYGPDGRLLYALGAAGGGTIPTQVAKTLMGLIDFRLPLADAVALPQLYSPGDTVTIEEGTMLADMENALRALGHDKITARRLPLKLNAAARTADGWVGAADPRSEGATFTN